MMKKLLAATALALGTTLVSVNASAEVFGLLHGRSANPGNMTEKSVEAGLIFGDFDTFGARFNYKLSDVMTVYGDLGLNDVDGWNGDGFGFGGGLYYYLPEQTFLSDMDVAVHGSFHMTTLDSSGIYGSGVDVDMNALAIDLLVSPQEALNEEGLTWFASAGLTRTASDVSVPGFGSASDSDIDISLSGGLTMPMGPGVVYGGLELVDGMSFGAGFRYPL